MGEVSLIHLNGGLFIQIDQNHPKIGAKLEMSSTYKQEY